MTLYIEKFMDWYKGLKTYTGNFPARGTISGALVVLEQLKTEYSLDINNHTAKGGSQIKGASGEAIRKILSDFDETRPFLSEGGRTNRGLRGDIEGMLTALKEMSLDNFDVERRNQILNSMQGFLVERVKEYHNQQRIKFVYNPNESTWQTISNILEAARETNKEGAVAQYLVGAKLQLRFPEIKIGNESYSTADDQLGRHGDFFIGSTVFHVTVAPMQGVYEKCKKNLDQGYRPYLLVSDRASVGAKQLAEQIAPGKIAVGSIETFVSQNVEEISLFSTTGLTNGLRNLLEIYNQRVDLAESDKSLLIEIPPNL
jgi:hypothetical protein